MWFKQQKTEWKSFLDLTEELQALVLFSIFVLLYLFVPLVVICLFVFILLLDLTWDVMNEQYF